MQKHVALTSVGFPSYFVFPTSFFSMSQRDKSELSAF